MGWFSRSFYPSFSTAIAVAIGVLLGATTVAAALVLESGSHVPPATSPTSPVPTHPLPPPVGGSSSCNSTNASVGVPSGPHGLFVLDPPGGPHNAHYQDVQTYLLHNPAVCGANFWVPWSSVDAGPHAHPEFNFSTVDANAAPWIAAGKEVNLVFQMVGGAPNNVPADVLSEVPTVRCGDSAVTPVEWNGTFETAYRSFISAGIHHFDAESGIGYLRFELGVSGELSPVSDIDATGCASQLSSHGFSLTVWANYLTGMLDYEHSLRPTVGLIVSLSPVYPATGDNVSEIVSAEAAADGIGLGSQGLRANDANGTTPGAVGCGGHGWCEEFSDYAGVVPLEVQPVSESSPDGSGPVGSLVLLLPFALGQHAQVFELYLDDWLTAFDPNYPAYAEFHLAYGAVFNETASVVGVGSS